MKDKSITSPAEKHCFKALKAMVQQLKIRNKKMGGSMLHPPKRLERQAKKWFNVAEYHLKRAREISKNNFIFAEWIGKFRK